MFKQHRRRRGLTLHAMWLLTCLGFASAPALGQTSTPHSDAESPPSDASAIQTGPGSEAETTIRPEVQDANPIAKPSSIFSPRKARERLPRELHSEFAWGDVVRVGSAGTEVWINMGREDGLREGVPFSVFDQSETDLRDASPKAKLVVTRIVAAHLSHARVTDMDHRQPIVNGDQVYSPAWRPGNRKVGFALLGLMDVDDDRQDDTEQVRELIRNMGGQVDVQIGPWGPPGSRLSSQTSFLVVGTDVGHSPDADPGQQAQQAVYDEFLQEAKRMGVVTIALSKILPHLQPQSSDQTIPLGRRIRSQDFPIQNRLQVPEDDRPRIQGRGQSLRPRAESDDDATARRTGPRPEARGPEARRPMERRDGPRDPQHRPDAGLGRGRPEPNRPHDQGDHKHGDHEPSAHQHDEDSHFHPHAPSQPRRSPNAPGPQRDLGIFDRGGPPATHFPQPPAQDFQHQIAIVDEVLSSDVVQRMLGLMEENVELKASLEMAKAEMHAEMEIQELRAEFAMEKAQQMMERAHEMQEAAEREMREARQIHERAERQLHEAQEEREHAARRAPGKDEKAHDLERLLAERETLSATLKRVTSAYEEFRRNHDLSRREAEKSSAQAQETMAKLKHELHAAFETRAKLEDHARALEAKLEEMSAKLSVAQQREAMVQKKAEELRRTAEARLREATSRRTRDRESDAPKDRRDD